MKRHLFRHLIGLAVLMLLLGHAVRLYPLDLVSRLDAIIYDAKLRLTMPHSIDDRIVIFDIDEKSLAGIGRWPWNRERMATLVDQIFNHYGIRVLGFDVVFAEPDHSSGLASLEQLARGPLKGDETYREALNGLRPKLDYDARFAAALRQRPVILGYYMSSSREDPSSGQLPKAVLPGDAISTAQSMMTRWQSYGGNLAAFQQNAAGGGHFNPIVDFDGIVRRVPMLAEFQGNYYESLSLAMARAYLDFPPIIPGIPSAEHGGMLEWLDLDAARGLLRIPIDENAAALIPYRGPEGSFRYFSIIDIMNGRIPVDQLKGRIALIGATAAGLKDLRATPVGEAYPGVEMHANLIAGMLDGTLKLKPQYAMVLDLLQLLITGGLMIFLLPKLSPLRASLLSLATLATLVGINLAFWQYGHFVLPLAASLLLILLLFAINMSWGYFVESHSKRQMTGLFGQYLPPELVEEMSRDPENYSMAGRRAELTVLFSDVRDFTSISEKLQPEELAALMNEYLGAMTRIIRYQRGTLDKYIGDAIMAFWGAPVTDTEHARHAVLAALEMQQAMPEVNRILAQKGWPTLKIGIGLNSGPMTVGDMGSPVRQSYTVMGDAVNLASRLEGITKQYGVGILVGENTCQQLKGQIAFREIDRVRVKGKLEPIGIFEPLGPEESLSQEQREELKTWQQMLRHYRAQNWDQAELDLLNLSRLSTTPNTLAQLYTGRIAHYRNNPPDSGWNGVTVFESK